MAKQNKKSWRSPAEILQDVGKDVVSSAESSAIEAAAEILTGKKSPEQALQDAGSNLVKSAEVIGEEQVDGILSDVVKGIAGLASGSKSKYEDHPKFDKFKKGKK
jgi:hypothetical protein